MYTTCVNGPLFILLSALILLCNWQHSLIRGWNACYGLRDNNSTLRSTERFAITFQNWSVRYNAVKAPTPPSSDSNYSRMLCECFKYILKLKVTSIYYNNECLIWHCVCLYVQFLVSENELLAFWKPHPMTGLTVSHITLKMATSSLIPLSKPFQVSTDSSI